MKYFEVRTSFVNMSVIRSNPKAMEAYIKQVFDSVTYSFVMFVSVFVRSYLIFQETQYISIQRHNIFGCLRYQFKDKKKSDQSVPKLGCLGYIQ